MSEDRKHNSLGVFTLTWAACSSELPPRAGTVWPYCCKRSQSLKYSLWACECLCAVFQTMETNERGEKGEDRANRC